MIARMSSKFYTLMEVVEEKKELVAKRQSRIPEHVAIIMDGNRRWAKQRGLPIHMGHWKGAEVVDEVVQGAIDLGIRVITLFAFSTENWNRDSREVSSILNLFFTYLHNKKNRLVAEGVKLNTIGDITKFSPQLSKKLQEVIEATAECSKIELVLALNYGSRNEITRAVKKIIDDVAHHKIQKQEVTENLISSYLDTSHWRDPDLLIRTSGEKRLSNFLLWQMSYTEVYTTEVLWPDFGREGLLDAVKEYQYRERRFGE